MIHKKSITAKQTNGKNCTHETTYCHFFLCHFFCDIWWDFFCPMQKGDYYIFQLLSLLHLQKIIRFMFNYQAILLPFVCCSTSYSSAFDWQLAKWSKAPKAPINRIKTMITIHICCTGTAIVLDTATAARIKISKPTSWKKRIAIY